VLAPALDNALRLTGHRAADIGRIACVRGPGSFTGLRLALVSAAGLARAVGARLAGLDYLPLLALNALPALREAGDTLWVVTHARHNLVYAQAFGREDARGGPAPLQALTELLVLRVADDAPENRLSSHIAAPGGRACLIGSGISRNLDALRAAMGSAVYFPGPSYDHPAPATLMRACLDAEYGDAPLEALYVRPCDAEDNLPLIAARLGLDPETARRRLAELTRGLRLES
jgi:tRNA threonylcarbamoyl adenosine modification protein YeaZ